MPRAAFCQSIVPGDQLRRSQPFKQTRHVNGEVPGLRLVQRLLNSWQSRLDLTSQRTRISKRRGQSRKPEMQGPPPADLDPPFQLYGGSSIVAQAQVEMPAAPIGERRAERMRTIGCQVDGDR